MQKPFEWIAVFCGSLHGRDDRYSKAAREFGRLLAARRIGLVYGGAKIGLMGELADAALSAGGLVYGVIPRALVSAEIAHTGCTELCVVDSMAERKEKMFNRADAFVAMPGGMGTLDEMFEAITANLLGMHQKACGFLNVDGYFSQLMSFLQTSQKEGFVAEQHVRDIVHSPDPELLLTEMARVSFAEPKYKISPAVGRKVTTPGIS